MKPTRSLMIVLLVLSLLLGSRAVCHAQSLTLTSVNPSSVQSGSFTLTLTGTGFTSTSMGEVGEDIPGFYPVSTTTTYVSPTQLTVSGYVYAEYGPIMLTVDVHNTATNQTSNILSFYDYPPLTVLSISLDHIKAGSGSFALNVYGDDDAPQVIDWTFNGVMSSIGPGFVWSPSDVQFTIPASLVTTPGVATVSGGYHSPAPFYITGNATVTSLSPNTASAGDHDFMLTINGTGFAPGDQAQWNGMALQTTYLSSTQLQAFVPASLVSTTGAAQITAAYAYPVSFTIGTVHVSGKVALEGETQPAQNVTLAFRPTSGTTTIFPMLLAADGSFDVAGIAPGTYNLAVKGYKWLQSVTPITVNDTPLSGVQVTLSGGDANGDNVVDTADFNILIGAFGGKASVPGSGYDIRADFNDDGVVNTADFNLLIGEFGNSGTP